MTEDSNGTADMIKIFCPLKLSTTEFLSCTTKMLQRFLCFVTQNGTWWDADIWNWGQNGSLNIIWQKYLRYFCSWKAHLHTGNKTLHSFLTLQQQKENYLTLYCASREVCSCVIKSSNHGVVSFTVIWSFSTQADLQMCFFCYDGRNKQGLVQAQEWHSMCTIVFTTCTS